MKNNLNLLNNKYLLSIDYPQLLILSKINIKNKLQHLVNINFFIIIIYIYIYIYI